VGDQPSRSSLSNAIADAVASSLRTFGYKYSVSPQQTDFRFSCRTVSRDWQSRILLAPPTSVVRLFSVVTEPYTADGKHWVAELVHRVNEKIACLGGFDFDYSTGAAVFRYGIDFADQQVTPGHIERMLNSASFPLEFFRTAFNAIGSKMSPEKAVDISLLLHGCSERAHNPKAAMKTILHVEHGGGKSCRGQSGDGAHPSIFLL
jgi:hypothetical protein